MVRCENDYFAFSYNKNRYIGVEGDESVEVLDIKKQFKQIFFKQIFDVPLYYDTTIVNRRYTIFQTIILQTKSIIRSL